MEDPIQQEAIRLLLMSRLKSRDQLRQWCKFFIDVDLADCIVSRFATTTPLDMVWEIYQFCANESHQEPQSYFYIAGRGSQKTLSCAVLQVLLPLHFGRGVVHYGGTEDQANRAYNFFKTFVSKPYIRPFLKEDPKISVTTFLIGGKEVQIEILALTQASTQGPHQPVVSIDELASLAPNKLAAYPDIAGVPVYTEDGKPWVKFGISSRKGRYTIIETEYEDRHKTGVEFKFWTVLENTKKCPDSVSGTVPTEIYINIEENKALLKVDYDSLPEKEKVEYEKVIARDKCYSCPLIAPCGGDAKKQTSKCRSLKPIQATIAEFKQADYDWFLSQKMSLKPSSEDLVYPRFDRQLFEKTPREIYQIFMGKDPGKELSEHELISIMVNAGVKRYAGLDHGYTHPTALVVIYEDGSENCYIMASIEVAGLEPVDVVKLVEDTKNKYDIQVLFPDTEDPAKNQMLKKVIRVHDDYKKSVYDGIQYIRFKMKPPVGDTKLYGLKGNVDSLCSNFEKYRFRKATDGKLTDDPVKESDDSHDALSYAAQNRWQIKNKIHIPSMKKLHDELHKETDEQYRQRVAEQQKGVMLDHVKKAIQESDTTANVQSSKRKNIFWSID